MDRDAFRDSLAGDRPPREARPALQVLWWASKGDWDRAHEIAQEMPGPDGAWLHGHLHREEGDLPNARYWYRRARREVPEGTVEEERAELLAHFIS